MEWTTDKETLEKIDDLLMIGTTPFLSLLDTLYKFSEKTPEWGLVFMAGNFLKSYHMQRAGEGETIELSLRYATAITLNSPNAQEILGALMGSKINGGFKV